MKNISHKLPKIYTRKTCITEWTDVNGGSTTRTRIYKDCQ
jgi:hypothetical protein